MIPTALLVAYTPHWSEALPRALIFSDGERMGMVSVDGQSLNDLVLHAPDDALPLAALVLDCE